MLFKSTEFPLYYPISQHWNSVVAFQLIYPVRSLTIASNDLQLRKSVFDPAKHVDLVDRVALGRVLHTMMVSALIL